MSHDDELAGRVRALSGGAEEKRMFGSLAFCVDGRIVVCMRGDGLLVRVGLPGMPATLAVDDGVHPAVMGTREMHGWVTVPADLVDT